MPKYICIDDPKKGDTIYIFPEHVVHKDVARDICNCNAHPISAGFVRLDAMGRFICYGESESLGIKSRPEDSDLANRMFGR